MLRGWPWDVPSGVGRRSAGGDWSPQRCGIDKKRWRGGTGAATERSRTRKPGRGPLSEACSEEEGEPMWGAR